MSSTTGLGQYRRRWKNRHGMDRQAVIDGDQVPNADEASMIGILLSNNSH
jgi:hypothetical protein